LPLIHENGQLPPEMTLTAESVASVGAAQSTSGLRPSGLRSSWRRFHRVSPSGSHIAVSAVTNVGIAALGLLSGPLAARLLGPAGRGEVAAIQNLFWLTAILAMLGLPEAATYFTARDPGKAGSVLATGIALPVLAMPVCFAVMYPLVPRILAAQPAEVQHAARWVLLAVPLYAAIVVGINTVRGANKLMYWNLLRILPGAGWLVFLGGAWLWGMKDPVRIAGGYIAVLACIVVPTLWIAARLVPSSWSPSPKLAAPMLRYGLPLAGAAIPQTLNLRLDQILIGAFLPPYQLGLYVAAVAWSTAVFLAPNAIGNVLFPRIASSANSPAQRAGLLAQGVRIGILTSAVVGVCLLALTRYAIPLLFGKAFAGAVPVAYVLIFAAVICAVNIIFEESLRGLGNTRAVFWGETVGVGMTVLALALLLPRFGIIGAGLASILGYGTTFAILTVRICGATGFSLPSLLPRRADLHFLALRLQGWWLIASQEAE
jgi:O-antigen/teichoic acid export membrane protein